MVGQEPSKNPAADKADPLTSDDEIRVAATPYGIAVTIALHDLSRLAAGLRADIRRGHFDNVPEYLKTLHDGVRGLRTELDIRNDSAWGRQLASIRTDISNSLQSEIDGVLMPKS